MSKPTVVATRALPRDAIALLERTCTVVENATDRAYSPDELIARARDADALVTLLTDRIDAPLFECCPRVRVVANVAVGYDNIDVAAAARHGVVVTNTPGVLTDATADFTWTLLLATVRRIVEADTSVRAGAFTEWKLLEFLGGDLAGRTLGIAGFGRIGQAVARRARGFGMHVIYTANARAAGAIEDELAARRVDKETLFAAADVISLHLPLTAATRGYVGAVELARCKPTAYLINTARGPILDEAALAAALAAGRLAGAALDVFEREPAVHPTLLTLPSVVLAPHIASATVETRTRMALMAAENVVAVLAGAPPPNPVRG